MRPLNPPAPSPSPTRQLSPPDSSGYDREENVGFYERFMRGEKVKAGWVNESDFEKAVVPQTPTL